MNDWRSRYFNDGIQDFPKEDPPPGTKQVHDPNPWKLFWTGIKEEFFIGLNSLGLSGLVCWVWFAITVVFFIIFGVTWNESLLFISFVLFCAWVVSLLWWLDLDR